MHIRFQQDWIIFRSVIDPRVVTHENIPSGAAGAVLTKDKSEKS